LRGGLIQLERVFWIAGLTLLAVCFFAAAEMMTSRRAAARIAPQLAPATEEQIASATAAPRQENGDAGSSPAVVGRIEIPAIGMVTPLLAGDDSMSLTQGAGHIPGTAYPGGLGTVGIAGHRDTHFRLLRKAAPGMDVRLIDRTGTYHYRVTSSEIVTPEQVSVLDIVSEPALVLITCYPFSYIGHAPKRFVVHAALVSAAPDEPSSR
jgi:sortase A